MSSATHTKFINPPPGAAPAHFQDRYVETQLLRDFLQNDAQRLLTVVGRGGIGKTAMVCRLLRALESGHLPDDLGPLAVDGIVYLSQTGTHQVNVPNLYGDLCKLLSTSDAQRLENLYKDPHIPTEAKLCALLAAFPQGRVLALLDNLEDGIDPATRALTDPELDEALRAILNLPQHALKVITTTRVAPQALALVHPERQMPLVLDEGLASPYAENILRAMDADGKLGLKNAPAALLATARERTQGYPRALEMLFASLNADRATSLPELLADTRALLPERVVEVLVGEAYSRLDRTAQMVMQALAIYARPVTPAAVDYVLQAHLPGVNSAPVLNRLVNMYFVRKEEGRYYLHPVDRAYAFGRVPVGAAADREAAERHYTQYALLDRAADYFHQARLPDEQWNRLDDLAPQLAEFDLRYAGEDYDTAAAVLQEIVVIILWGHYKLYVQHGEQLRDKITDPFLKARWIVNLGQAYFYLGEFHLAIPLLKQGLQEVGRRHQGYIYSVLGNCYADMGQTQQAIKSFEQALLLAPHNSDILGNLGTCYADMGQNDQAKEFYKRALQIANTPALYAWLADVLIEEQQYEEAIEWATKGKEAAMATNDSLAASLNHLSIATACLLSNNLADARKAAQDGSQYESPRSKHTVLALLGLSAVRQGDYIPAQAAFQAAVTETDLVLVRNSNNYLALDAKGLALSGLAICNDKQYIPLTVDAYRAARTITRAPGIVQRALHLFDALAVVDAVGVLAGVRAVVAGEG